MSARIHVLVVASATACAGDDSHAASEMSSTTLEQPSSSSVSSDIDSTDVGDSGAGYTSSGSSSEEPSSSSITGEPACGRGSLPCELPEAIQPLSTLSTQAHSGDGARELGVNLAMGARAQDDALAILIVPYAPESIGAEAAVQKRASDGTLEWEVVLPPDARAVDIRPDGSVVAAGGTELWIVEVDSVGTPGPTTPITGWDDALVGIATSGYVFVLGLDAADVPILARIDSGAVAWTLHAPGDLPAQSNDMAIEADGAIVVVAGRLGSQLVLAGYDADMVEAWRWEAFGGDFTFRPLIEKRDGGWLTATSSPPSVHFLDEAGEPEGVVELPEPASGPGLITSLLARGPTAWLTLVALAQGVNDQPSTDLLSVQVDEEPCCSVHVFDMWQAHFPALMTSTTDGDVLMLGDSCEGVTCSVAQTTVTQR